jgi:succinoglycan biosynthesis transport protein ExoP
MQVDSRKALEDELFGVGIDASVAQSELRLLGNLSRALRRSWRWIALVALLGGVAGYVLSYRTEVRYTSVAQVMIETRVSGDTQFTPFISDLPVNLTALQTELEVLRSLDLVERVVDNLNLQSDKEFFDPSDLEEDAATPAAATDEAQSTIDLQREQTIANVGKRRVIEQVGDVSAVYAISFTSRDPKKAAVLANALAEEYVSTTRTAKLRSLELSQGWLTQRVTQLQEKLSDLGVQLEQNLLSAPYSQDEIETIKARSVAAERRLKQLNEEASGISATISRIQGLLAQDRPLLAAHMIEQPSAALTSAMDDFKAGVEGAGDRLAAELQSAMDQLNSRLTDVQLEMEPIIAESERTQAVLLEQARRDAETKRIENDIAVSEAIYQDFMTQLSRRTEQNEYLDADARIIALARPPLLPSEPIRRVQAAFGLGAGAMLAMLFVLMRELFQHRMRNIHEFENGTGLPLIGVVPEVSAGHAPFATFLGADGGIAPELMRFARKLRWSILAELPGDKPSRFAGAGMGDDAGPRRKSRSKTSARSGAEMAPAGSAGGYGAVSPDAAHTIIAGASANRNDGQSSSMLALACSFADGGEKVLLIDCDFGHSPFAAMLNESDANLEYIRFDPRKAKQFIVETSYEGLHVLPAPKSAVEAAQKIGAAEWWRLFRHLSTQYDRILLDTPPLMSGIDTAVLHQAADAVLLFARWNSTTTGETRSMLKVLGDVGVTPIAVVATRIELDRVRRFGDDALFYLGKSMSA